MKRCSEEFRRKVHRALLILDRTGMSRNNYLPAMYPLYWKLGLEIPPPHFLSFVGVMLVAGLPLGLFMLGLCIAAHETSDASALSVLALSAAVMLIWGGIVAVYYRTGRIRHHLPSWASL